MGTTYRLRHTRPHGVILNRGRAFVRVSRPGVAGREVLPGEIIDCSENWAKVPGRGWALVEIITPEPPPPERRRVSRRKTTKR